MIIRFNNLYLESLAFDKTVKGKPKFDAQVIAKFKKTLNSLESARDTTSLRNLRSLNFEALRGDRKGFFSVRVDIRYRLIFTIEQDVLTVNEIIIVEDLTNHYS